MTSLEYTVTCSRKYVNHVSVQIDDDLKWVNVESFINQLDSAIVKNHVAKVRTMLASIGIKQITMPVIKADSDLSRVIVSEFHSILKEQPASSYYDSEVYQPMLAESKNARMQPQPVDDETPDSALHLLFDNQEASARSGEKKVKHKSKKNVSSSASLTSDTKKMLDIMERSGRDKWPKFGEESSRRNCINYIKNNLRGKNTTFAEHIYKEITDFLRDNPGFANPD